LLWATCLVFFQLVLLLGYLFVHLFATRLRLPKQLLAYLMLLCAALAQLGVTLGQDLRASTAHPIFSVFWLLSALIGIPFLALSAASPLLQAWYGYATITPEPASPYHLYAISIFGSLLALVVYPTLIEPRFTLRGQIVAWSLGFAVFTILCGVIHWRSRSLFRFAPNQKRTMVPESPPSVTDRVLWVLLAASASLLLCAVTNHLSQNVAAVPLLWIMPLGLYLLSFVTAFNGWMLWPRWPILCLLAVALGSVGYILYRYSDIELRLAVIPIFCAVLFIACLFCHGEAYRLRPGARYLTSFYLSVSVGGTVGAFFVGVLAPVVFSANYELFWGLIFVSALAAAISWKQSFAWFLFYGAGTLAMVVLLIFQVRTYERDTIARMRSFYGPLRVTETPSFGHGTVRTLYNGTIEHGTQLYGSGLRLVPNTYYADSSGVGLALNFCCSGKPRRVGVIGLGAGTLAAHGRKGDVFRFYEINPLVERIALNQFTYLSMSDASIQIVLGDARVSLAAESSQQFDVLAVDAFSGDAIPVHLLTAQAFTLYRRHLKPAGILAIHVTNRYVNLAPVVQQQADHAGLQAVLIISSSDPTQNIARADWVLVSGNTDLLSLPELAAARENISGLKGLRLWNDDYNSLLPVVRWNRREER
jgi:spermidine synthase